MAFSTWTALKDQMLDDLSSNNTTHGSYSGPGGRQLSFRSFQDWQRLYEFVETKAANETTSNRRVYAKPWSGTW